MLEPTQQDSNPRFDIHIAFTSIKNCIGSRKTKGKAPVCGLFWYQSPKLNHSEMTRQSLLLFGQQRY
jgi:hypothetical protein